ncbi:tyrosine-type recombinase/integrase [Streptomyces lavendulocolor]|uniref:tyrosine-type recombinase/integrase n=1 Tax=Streptomyces lavendulocolor TaxID=67316 RepID=UPI003C2B004F
MAARRPRKQRSRSAAAERHPPYAWNALQLIVAKCDTDIFGLRDRAMLLLGFAIAARRAELAGLRLQNITEDADGKGLLVSVRVCKTEPRTVPVSYGSSAATCPVRAWHAWRDAAGISDPDRHAFRRIHHTGAVQPHGLIPQRAGDIITAAGRRAGFEELFTGHSVRSGTATGSKLARQGQKNHRGHHRARRRLEGPRRLHADRRPVCEEDNALIGIGL